MQIKDIPTSNDYFLMGVEHLMIGYNEIIEFLNILIQHKESKDYFNMGDPVSDAKDISSYFNNARLNLLVHTGLIHEGIDLILKSKITEVSPYLLIRSDPNDIKGKVYYSDLLTQDSKSLPVIHDKFCSNPLDSNFVTLFEKSRTRRNKIRHTYDVSLTVEAKDVIIETLNMFMSLQKTKWMENRYQYSNREAILDLYSWDQSCQPNLLIEFKVLQDVLPPAEFKKVFKTDKKQRMFLCYDCTHPDYTENVKTCVIKSTGKRRYIECLICSKLWSTKKVSCPEDDCECDILVSEKGKCANCAEYDFER